jgi:Flp pilus assembly protein TadD
MLRALQLDPDQTLALQLQVFWLLQQERFDEADAALNRFGDNAQRDHRFLNTLGMLRLERRDFEAAVRSFEQALQINVSIPEVHYNLALTYELWGRCAVAHQYWIIYLQQDSDERRRAAVRSRLQNNFETMGGRCYGWERSR